MFPEDDHLLVLSERVASRMHSTNRAEPGEDNYADWTGHAIVCDRGRRLSIMIDGMVTLELRRIDERWRVMLVGERSQP